jgi:protocatechuate 3,4-dioxygenase beta subunit
MKIKTPPHATRLAACVSLATLAAVSAFAAAAPTRTPALTDGPFYPFNSTNTLPHPAPANRDNDLTRVEGAATPARGTVFLLSGIVRDASGKPVPGATVELWQTDDNGAYYHSGDSAGKRDPAFQHYGEHVTAADGRYSFRTVMPGLYTGRIRHFHFKVKLAGATLIGSQFIFEEERAKFRSDGVTARLSGDALEAIVLNPRPGTDATGAKALLATKDIVVDATPSSTAQLPTPKTR